MPEAIEKKRITYNPAAVDKYKKKAYDRLEISVRKGRKAKIKAVAKKQGESLNGFVVAAIDERVERLDSSPASEPARDGETERRLSALDEFFETVNASDEEVPEAFERIKLREVVV